MSRETEKFAAAADRFRDHFILPAEDLLELADAAVTAANREANQARITMEVLRPVWAQGWTTDAQAAQASANALAELWGLLGAVNQTEAMERLRALTSRPSIIAGGEPE